MKLRNALLEEIGGFVSHAFNRVVEDLIVLRHCSQLAYNNGFFIFFTLDEVSSAVLELPGESQQIQSAFVTDENIIYVYQTPSSSGVLEPPGRYYNFTRSKLAVILV